MFTIDLPARKTFLPYLADIFIICCTRWMLEANVAAMMRRSLSAKYGSSELYSRASEGVYPGRSALVESHIRSRTPLAPSSASRCRSMVSPMTGVWSILKSPVWIILPAGVSMHSAADSGMEWVTEMNSTEKAPNLSVSPALTSIRSA